MRIPNNWWIAWSPLAITGIILNQSPPWILIAWGIGFTITGLGLWALGLLGGADAKGIMLLGWATPMMDLGQSWISPFLIALTLAVATSSMIQRIRPQPFPFFLALSPFSFIGLIIQATH